MTEDRIPECAMESCWAAPASDAFLVFRTKKDRKASLTVPLDLSLCESCGGTAKVGDFLDDGLWAQVVERFEKIGKEPPDRNLTTLGLRPIPRVLLP